MGLNNFLLENIILPIGDLLTKGSFISNLKLLRKITKLSEAELDRLQEEKLRKVLLHATRNSQYYKSLNTKEISDTRQWLKQFPILDKRILRDQSDNLLTEAKEKLIKHGSSGSTGFQSIVYWSDFEQSVNRATQILWWEWAGYRLGNPIVQTGINSKRTLLKSIKDKLLNTYYLQAFSHSKEDAAKALAWASKQDAPVLAGYASSLYVLATYAEELGVKVKFESAVSWGDKMFDHFRKKINTSFDVNVKETYGSAEGLMLASQYDLDYMYIMTPNIYMEIVDDNGNEVPDGEMGHVIVTNLNAFAMPLIRYRLGDLAIKLPRNSYPNKRALALPILQKVIGRDTDLVKTNSGKYMVVHSFTGIFEHLPEIEQFCVIQENLDGIIIEFIPASNFKNEILDFIKDKILKMLNEDFVIEFRKVTHIAPTKSGKPQLIQSKIK